MCAVESNIKLSVAREIAEESKVLHKVVIYGRSKVTGAWGLLNYSRSTLVKISVTGPFE